MTPAPVPTSVSGPDVPTSGRGSRLAVDTLLERLTDRDLALLGDLDDVRLAPTRQLQRLHFALSCHRTLAAATRACMRVLSRLSRLGLVVHLPRRIGGVRAGSAGFVWQLGPTGQRLLAVLHGDPQRHRLGQPASLFVAHTLAITEMVVTLREHAAAHPDVTVTVSTEPSCWQPFTGPHGRPETLRPDLLVVTTSTNYVDQAFVEIDRATEHLPALIRKSHVYARYAATGTYQARHGVFPAVVWVVPTSSRAAALQAALDGEPHLDALLFTVTTTELATGVLVGADPAPDDEARGAETTGTEPSGAPPPAPSSPPPPTTATARTPQHT